jgi:quinol monooxygenase YgiN
MRETDSCRVASHESEVAIMSKLAIWAQVEAKAGKEQDVAQFLKSAQALAEKEQGTLTWYAVKLGEAKFGIFDTFADEKGREAHLNGEIAKALFGKARELFVREPEVHKLEVLAAKASGGAKAYGA